MSIQVTARVDERKQKEFENICESLGLTVPTAINIFIQQVINYRGLPFAMQVPETLDEYVELHKPQFREALHQAEKGKFHVMTEVERDAF
jgi:addiction module RelB/DinJ family antitoxin